MVNLFDKPEDKRGSIHETIDGVAVHIFEESKNGDPWAHRSENMKCKTCMWFVPKGELGRCRRHAPTLSGYPVVTVGDWCGDHKLDETKVSL